jgi:hypothetical protein
MFGDSALSVPIGIVDGGFENTELTDAWKVTGDARQIGVFGLETPFEDEGMAMLLQGSSISQEFISREDTTEIAIYERTYRRGGGDSNVHDDWYMPYLGSRNLVRVEEVANANSFVEEELWPFGWQYLQSPLLGNCSGSLAPKGPAISPWLGTTIRLPETFKKKALRITISFNKGEVASCSDALLLDGIRLRP